MTKILKKFTVLPLLLAVLAWTAVGVLPIFDQSIIASKFLFTLVTALLLMISYFSSGIKKGILSYVKSPFSIPTGLFGVITLISIFANNKYPVESLLGLGGSIIAFSIIILLGSTLIKSQATNNKLMVTLASLSGILAVTTLLQQFSIGPSIILNMATGTKLPANLLFNLSGSILVALQFTLVVAVGFSTKVLITKKAKTWESVTLAISALASLFYGWYLLPGKITSPILLSPSASWSIAVSSIKNLKTFIIGIGPDNYIKAFNLYKPEWLNSGPLWNVQFSQGASLPFTLIVTLGIFGLAAWVMFAHSVIKQTKKVDKATRPIHSMLITTLMVQLFFPMNIVILVLQAVLVVFWVSSEKDRLHSYNLDLVKFFSKFDFLKNKGVDSIEKEKNPITSLMIYKSLFTSRVVVGTLLLLSIGLLCLTLRASYSSFLMFQSAQAAAKNDFVTSYNLQQDAVQMNSYLDSGRRKYAVTNIVIAAAISQKTELTTEDKERFAILIQQSIRESKAAILLDNTDIENWQTLAQIYQTLIGVADNSDEWTVKSYTDAIRLAPNNPQLRLTLGKAFYDMGEYGEAIKMFDQAATLKPDYANTYYNAANAFKKLEMFEEARVAYQKTLILLQPDSDDYLRAANELQILEEIANSEMAKKQAQEVQTESLPIEGMTTVDDVTPDVEAPPESVSDSSDPIKEEAVAPVENGVVEEINPQQ